MALIVLGFVDFFYQRWEFERDIKMSKKEIKDERKDIEGNPEIKRKQRQMMAEMSQRRMMEEVPSATVVVTNPTHLSIAIKFVLEKMNAPVVVAKGVDHIALRIREIAKEYHVPLYEDKKLGSSRGAWAMAGATRPRAAHKSRVVIVVLMRLPPVDCFGRSGKEKWRTA